MTAPAPQIVDPFDFRAVKTLHDSLMHAEGFASAAAGDCIGIATRHPEVSNSIYDWVDELNRVANSIAAYDKAMKK